jgi:hypothetical protein
LEEGNRISCQLYESFFQVANLSCLGFFKSDGTEASVAFDLCARGSDISFTQFQATIAPASFSSALVDTPSSTVNYFLKLPQSMPPPKPSVAPIDTAPAPPLDTHDGNRSTPDTVGMAAVRKAFADGSDPTGLDLNDPAIATALASTADKDFDDIFTPGSAKRQLFSTKPTSPSASPSIRCYLTTATTSALPSFCGPLNDYSQALFDAVFPPIDRKPILALRLPQNNPASASRPDDPTETAIQACISKCRMLVFKAMLRLDYIAHLAEHNRECFVNHGFAICPQPSFSPVTFQIVICPLSVSRSYTRHRTIDLRKKRKL